MMEDAEEFFKKRYDELQQKLTDETVMKKVDQQLMKICKLVNCDVEITFTIRPHLDHYSEYQETDEFAVPTDVPTINLGILKKHLSKERDDNMNVYIDPIYLEKNKVNSVLDVLITTIDNDKGILIIPIANNNVKQKIE